jgi:hypothetical protein
VVPASCFITKNGWPAHVLRAHALDRDHATDLLVAGGDHLAHPAGADDRIDPIARTEVTDLRRAQRVRDRRVDLLIGGIAGVFGHAPIVRY